MPMNFPDAPTNGQSFSSGGVVWLWNGITWNPNSTPGSAGVNVAIADTAPSNPANGNLWWNSSPGDGQLYISYNDGTSQQYVVCNNLGGGIYLPLTGGTVTGVVTLTGPTAALTLNDRTSTGTAWSLFAQGGTGAALNFYNSTQARALATLDQSSVLTLIANVATTLPSLDWNPFCGLRITGADNTYAGVTLDAFGSDFTIIEGRKARGTGAAPTRPQNSDILFRLQAAGYTGSAFTGNTYLDLFANENWTSTANGTAINFVTTPNGATAAVLSMAIMGSRVVIPASLVANGGITEIGASGQVFGIGLYGGYPTINFAASNFIQYNPNSGQGMYISVNSGTLTFVSLGNIIQGSGQIAAWDTNGVKNASLAVYGAGGAAGDGGAIEFGSNNGVWKFACIKGWATDGANNSRGELVFFTRRNSTDATLTEAFRVRTDGGISTPGTFYAGYNIQPPNNASSCGFPGSAWAQVCAYAFPNASDIKYKTDIEDLPDCLPFVTKLHPQRYKFTNGPDHDRDVTHWGFVAQHVEAVLGGGKDFGGHRVENDEQTIAYHELTAVLWKALQEVVARLEAVEGKI